MDDSAIMCGKVRDVHKETNFNEKKATCKTKIF